MDLVRVLAIGAAVAASLLVLLAGWRARRAAVALVAWDGQAARTGAGRLWWRPLLLAVAAAAAVVAAIGHGPGRERRAPAGQLVPVVFALDVSRSMDVADTAPTRRTAGESLVQRLVQRPEALNAGLIVFAGEAVVVCPLTTDTTAQQLALAEAAVLRDTLIGGSAVGPALSAAVDALPRGRRGAVVLVSDGDDTAGELDAVLARATARGVVVHTVGVGTPEGRLMPVRRADAGRTEGTVEQRVARLDEDRLRDVARATGGTYLRWDGSEASLRAVERLLADEHVVEPASRLPLPWVQASVAVAFAALAWEPWIGRRPRRRRG